MAETPIKTSSIHEGGGGEGGGVLVQKMIGPCISLILMECNRLHSIRISEIHGVLS